MESAERSWYLEQMGVPEWVPRDSAALVEPVQSAANESAEPKKVTAADETKISGLSSTGPEVGPSDILAKLRASNGPKAKQQSAETRGLAEEFTRPPTEEQLKQLATKPVVVPAPVPAAEEIKQPPKVVAASVAKPPIPSAPAQRTPAPAVSTEEPDFSVDQSDAGDLEALFAESMAFNTASDVVEESGPDSLEKIDRDWKLLLGQAGCLPACLGEGAEQPAVIVVNALPADLFDNRQLDQAWRLHRSILSAAKLPAKVSFSSALYSVSSIVKSGPLLKRLRALYPEAIFLCFANSALEADLAALDGKNICLPSLDQMLAQPVLKRKAWDQLQKAIPAFEKLAK